MKKAIMYKKYLFIALLIMFQHNFLNAQNFNLRNYSDHRQGFRGVATAIFVDNIADIICEIPDYELEEMMLEYLEEIFGSRGRLIDRITRNNQWLARQALNEWDLENYDIFFVITAEHRFADSALIMIVLIEDNGASFRWWGRVVSEF